MARTLAGCLVAVLLSLPAQASGGLVDHFLNGPCRIDRQPILIVTDVTTSGEIDDSVSLLMYRELERRGCVRVVGVVSIFGNGGSSTAQVHKNLDERIKTLGLAAWRARLLRGPDRTSFRAPNAADDTRLRRIAEIVRRHPGLVMAELGPWTVSSLLLMHRYADPAEISAILGVGGRRPGERFATGRTLAGSLFGFRDMNVAEDTRAVSYLLRHHPDKLWQVTYRTGLGPRTVHHEAIGAFAPTLARHARKRWRTARHLLGYDGIPLWDTWTTSYFLRGGNERLGCRKVPAAMRSDDNGFRDPMQLHLGVTGAGSSRIVACHQ
ncbi:hypothetical protein GN330_00030 [Nitratireductor sp. CAU 1489]|uniref:Inosine/uridine-preferring nucleoside hydrolase domain-containing protein n=1 Tax=Nitratireductor arenosus TaxID=2682096 RepID=A0A844QCD6_9HYPH|nr:hypothetical protein [Nitratireductor arenosus]MVA95641.1 hypothetical protein [Nitratireductor arenosus]